MNTPSESNGESRIAQWEKAAAKSAPGGRLEDLNWRTPDGITVKPLYTAEDVQGLAHADLLCALPRKHECDHVYATPAPASSRSTR